MSVRVQTYLVLGVIVACFSILYPKIFHPMLLHLLGFANTRNKEEHTRLENLRLNSHHPPKQIRTSEGIVQQDHGKRGGIMSMVLPIYAVGIVLYLLYTLSKIFSSKRRRNTDKKEEFLRQYYRDFHYDADKGKFRMGHDSSDDDEDETDTFGNSSSLDFLSSRRLTEDSKSKPFEWGSVFKDSSHQDIYRSARSLPKDLGKLLMRMERQDLDSEELSRLRVRLEQTEQEMTRILRAMQSAEDAIRGSVKEQPMDEEMFATTPLIETTSYKQQPTINFDEDDMESIEELDKEITDENELEYSSDISHSRESIQIPKEEVLTLDDHDEDDLDESCIRRRLITST
ncbi:Resistance to inhibitors of cholinesterase protein isoform 1 [Schistosoma japonicum]|uniref:Resistance to inhibitors of cholinesterase protein isoform 1 n=1 Tax=Schistosoma japonicum TaxID=6182 RepID=A0A4Z2D6Y9_SCHJA|nr:Resistance to inhibitors of cholinesterase protein 3 [Schistosoma japonicum]TNN11950.1 Resistance to inhibitors of cholinesterase protein isoform 1 [Schistosoma japonicum]